MGGLFHYGSARISGVSPVGRATAALLRFNSADRLELRERLIAAEKFS